MDLIIGSKFVIISLAYLNISFSPFLNFEATFDYNQFVMIGTAQFVMIGIFLVIFIVILNVLR